MGKKIDDVLQILRSAERPLTAQAIYGLSDLSDEDLNQLRASWGAIPVERRLLLVRRLVEVAETNFEMDFAAVTRLALTDLDDEVREVAVEATWTDESPDMLRRLMTLASGDSSEGVRAAAASALGRFILEGELGKFDPGLARQAENIAIKLYQDENEDVDVRRRALEAIANSGRSGVTDMIEEAYQDDNPRMRTSAIFAMGRSCDSRWSSVVLRELISENPEMRFEAARAAGELELRESAPYLADLLQESDREIMLMAIWALGEIGGAEAQRLLEDMIETADEAGDEDLVEALEEALSSAHLVGDDLEL